ncbi:ABC transporter substrate-binding protein [Nitrincola tibetensis]|uniref:ABC transporter substrate-binding protein n=1 Tax=Nitrincola tibetensis TaxID=2219697 RepID=A0A364NLY4_9GAMM|nr:ABC transporter substrate-binding protein [Nitrincola tibetensis]RAU18128.1 ABC transporter substrate-binding protein [Nitrincola tibetensis]
MNTKQLLASAVLSITLAASAQAQSLTVYSAGPESLINHLAQDFTAQSGIAVNVFQGTTGQVMARLEAEQANPIADILISASWDSAIALKARGDLLEHVSPNAVQVPEYLKDTHYVAQGVSALAMVWNKNSQVDMPKDWSDLAQPAYNNEVTMPDPAQSGAAFQLLTGLLASQGEDATWSLMQQLKDNNMIVPGPNARALNPVLQGAKSVVFGAVDYISLGQQADGEAIEVVFPESGTVIAPRPMMIFKSTKSPDQAKAFIDFVLSDAGQERVAQSYLMPARTDIPALRPTLTELNLIQYDEAQYETRREDILQSFRAIFGQSN